MTSEVCLEMFPVNKKVNSLLFKVLYGFFHRSSLKYVIGILLDKANCTKQSEFPLCLHRLLKLLFPYVLSLWDFSPTHPLKPSRVLISSLNPCDAFWVITLATALLDYTLLHLTCSLLLNKLMLPAFFISLID